MQMMQMCTHHSHVQTSTCMYTYAYRCICTQIHTCTLHTSMHEHVTGQKKYWLATECRRSLRRSEFREGHTWTLDVPVCCGCVSSKSQTAFLTVCPSIVAMPAGDRMPHPHRAGWRVPHYAKCLLCVPPSWEASGLEAYAALVWLPAVLPRWEPGRRAGPV